MIGSAASELTLMSYTIPINLPLTHVKCHAKFIIVGFGGVSGKGQGSFKRGGICIEAVLIDTTYIS